MSECAVRREETADGSSTLSHQCPQPALWLGMCYYHDKVRMHLLPERTDPISDHGTFHTIKREHNAEEQ